MRILLSALLFVSVVGAGGADEALLVRRDIEPTAAGIRTFLRDLAPTVKQREAALALAKRLGGNSFQRDEATRKLRFMPGAAVAALKAAVRSSDPEVRRRARPLLDRMIELVPTDELVAALRVIRMRRMPGFADMVIQVLPLCFDRYGLDQAERALRATVGPPDHELLHKALSSAETDTRALAVSGLGALGIEADTARIAALVRDPAEQVSVAAAVALADRGQQACVPALVRLLGANDAGVRCRAAAALRHISGHAFDYDAFDPPKPRDAAAARWQQWSGTISAEQKWLRPLPMPPIRHGRTLIAVYNRRRVVELDSAGVIVWEITPDTAPWVVVGLPSGDRLVSYYQRKSIVRYDRHGREAWRKDDLPGSPTSVRPLPNGNILVTCGYQNVVLELRWDGKQLWELSLDDKPTDAARLADGGMMITLSDGNRVIERDAKGKTLWSLRSLRTPYSAQRLDNGNTLVCELGAGRVSEWNRKGDLVWSHANVTWIYRAQRLPGGRTLIAVRTGVHEVHADGRTRAVFTTLAPGDYLWVSRY